MLCTVTQVEELKILLRMFPIWASGIVFAAVYAQVSTMFLEQGMTLILPGHWNTGVEFVKDNVTVTIY